MCETDSPQAGAASMSENGGEEVPGHELAAVGDPGPRQHVRCLREPGGAVEHDPPQARMSTQDSCVVGDPPDGVLAWRAGTSPGERPSRRAAVALTSWTSSRRAAPCGAPSRAS